MGVRMPMPNQEQQQGAKTKQYKLGACMITVYSEFSQLRKKREAIQVYKKQTFYFLLVQVMRPCSVSPTYNTFESKEDQVITTYQF